MIALARAASHDGRQTVGWAVKCGQKTALTGNCHRPAAALKKKSDAPIKT
jgi:hypothetical protein